MQISPCLDVQRKVYVSCIRDLLQTRCLSDFECDFAHGYSLVPGQVLIAIKEQWTGWSARPGLK